MPAAPDTPQDRPASRLRVQYPRSFAVLLISGFALVALPLLGGMINTAYLLEKISRDGRRSIATTLETTRATRQLQNDVTTLQRAVGQYLVLEDPGLRGGLDLAHEHFQGNLAALRRLPLDAEQQAKLNRLAEQEADLYASARQPENMGTAGFDRLAPRFEALRSSADHMVETGYRLIDRQSERMDQTADAAWRALLLQAAAIVPLSLGIALLFSWLINRPVQQLAKSIRRLGNNDLTPAPLVNGPRDLIYLGEQLDWLRRRLIELEEQKQTFLRHVSHELKTPLASLREGVELLADRVGGDLTAQQEEITQIMRGNARELQRRIEDLIAYNRALQQGESPTLTEVDPRPLWETVLARQDLALRAKSLTVEMEPGDVRVRAESSRLETVFDNLLTNAVRFSPEGGRIRIGTRVSEGRVHIQIQDQGPGIAAQDREHIFQPFYQGSLQPQGHLRGSGLGLAIVREYVASLDGWVNLQDSPGQGACFQVVLNASQGEPDA